MINSFGPQPPSSTISPKSAARAVPRPSIDTLSKASGISVGVLYLFGFLVVLRHLSQYGVSSFEVVRLQYLVAGFWVLSPAALLAAMIVHRNAAEATYGELSRKRWWGAAILVTGLQLMQQILFYVVAAVLVSFGIGTSWRHASDFIADPRVLIAFGCLFVSMVSGMVTWGLLRLGRHFVWSMFAGGLAVLFFLLYVSRFAVDIYPKVPYSLGGGKPLRVAFLLRPDTERLAPLVRDGHTNRSIPYSLLTASGNSFVVVAPESEFQSIEFNRDCVAGVAVVKSSN